MILTVSGWRDWKDANFVHGHLVKYRSLWGPVLYVRVGDCRTGVDLFTRQWLESVGSVGFVVYRANWDLWGREAAGPVRNSKMLRGVDNPDDLFSGEVSDKLLAFPQPGIGFPVRGSGTVGCVREASKLRIDLDIPGYKGPDMTRGEKYGQGRGNLLRNSPLGR